MLYNQQQLSKQKEGKIWSHEEILPITLGMRQISVEASLLLLRTANHTQPRLVGMLI